MSGAHPVSIDISAVGTLHPSHLQLLMPMLQRETVEKLQNCSRLTARLLNLLPQEKADLASLPFPTGSLERLALQSSATVGQAGLRMAGLAYGRSLARYVEARDVAALDAALGASTRLFSIRQAARLAASLPDIPPLPADTSPQALIATIGDCAWQCLARWRDIVETPYRALASLKLPAVGLPSPASASFDPVIRAIAMDMDVDA
ncbi:hypothetical protein [Kozakia baliensis]|uniref:Uncharacterized protein n=1 Tax=Kozakia baliensis TaxID=153496 RepID=A0A1D8USL4_9PROT|nr:hypothetical protein [Kozakia baliensis]AOX16634.1 hypothetical protein A0U89_05285 [Kozakia baliensis]GEL65243.1 hypothetical protein KBA01_25290 [Kozakia baliensis]